MTIMPASNMVSGRLLNGAVLFVSGLLGYIPREHTIHKTAESTGFPQTLIFMSRMSHALLTELPHMSKPGLAGSNSVPVCSIKAEDLDTKKTSRWLKVHIPASSPSIHNTNDAERRSSQETWRSKITEENKPLEIKWLPSLTTELDQLSHFLIIHGSGSSLQGEVLFVDPPSW
ncbi:hypothetical protein B0O80DRAFT_157650 [Mortierella sp. GBAus27b]|nr:hypothetical protein B0O80DRAFT_157650 [Mortierella sp. GBAus27b]